MSLPGLTLTASRRFAFSASRRLARPNLPPEVNERVWGAGAEREWGSGENYEATFVFTGEVDATTGMLVNLASVKERLSPLVEKRYDHKFLNGDTPPFDLMPPTPENVARQLLAEACEAARDLPVSLVACHLAESGSTGATAWRDGRVEREVKLEFSAARRTFSPHLTEQENAALFGKASSPAGHGHGYSLRVVLAGQPDPETGLIVEHAEVSRAVKALHELLDHKNLSLEVPELAGAPMTSECLARFVFTRLAAEVPVARVRLHEMPSFFAEFDGRRGSLGLESSFSAAHCLRVAGLSDADNFTIYGKCSNPNGHGHRYTIQATIAGPVDERSGTVFSLERFDEALQGVLAELDHRHLDREVPEFAGRASTGEHIALSLWPKLAAHLDPLLVRLRVLETANNRFTLRRLEGSCQASS